MNLNNRRRRRTFDDADAVHDGRVVAFVDEMCSADRLDAKTCFAEVDFTSPIVEVECRELVASQTATDADRQAAEEAQFIGVGDHWALCVDGAHRTDLVSDRVDVDRTMQQSAVL